METPSGPRLYVLSRFEPRIYEIDARMPPLRPPSFLTCAQIDRRLSRIELAFENNGPYDRIEVYRDREPLDPIDGAATRHVDEGAPPGVREYALRGVKGDATSDFARSTVRVGLGAVLERKPTCHYVTQITQDPTDGSFLVLGHSGFSNPSGIVYRYDRDFGFMETIEIEDVVQPWSIDTLALRVGFGGERILYYIARDGVERESRLFLFERPLGGPTSSTTEIFPPQSPGMFVRPLGLLWDPQTDTFYYQERNSDSFVQMDLDGTTLRVFPNPAPPLSFQVEDSALALQPLRRTLFFASADPGEPNATKAVEMRLDGTLTGLEVPLPSGPSIGNAVAGFTFTGGDLTCVGTMEEGTVFLRLKVFADEGAAGRFRRGDSNGDGSLNITDPISLLGFLFLGGERPPCFDAADADDSGALEITDPIRILNHLFLGGEPLPAPGSDVCGGDPTEDIPGNDFGCAYPLDACP